MDPAMTRLEAEEQLVRLLAALRMQAHTAAFRRGDTAPESDVGPAQDAEHLEQQGRIVREAIGAGHPGVLVEAQEHRFTL